MIIHIHRTPASYSVSVSSYNTGEMLIINLARVCTVSLHWPSPFAGLLRWQVTISGESKASTPQFPPKIAALGEEAEILSHDILAEISDLFEGKYTLAR